MHWKEVRVQFDVLEGSRDDQVVTLKKKTLCRGGGGGGRLLYIGACIQ